MATELKHENNVTEIPEGWVETSLADVSEKIAMGPFGSNIKVSTFVDSGVPVISGQHLKGHKLEDSKYNFVTPEHSQKLKNSIVQKGDVIFTHAGNIGQVALVPDDAKYSQYVISQRQFYLRPNTDRLDPYFLTYYFKSRLGQHKLLSNASQVGVPSIAQPSSHLKSIRVDLPPILEQKAIAEVLSSLDNKIELLREQNETLEKTAQAIFNEWFGKYGVDDELPKGWTSSKISNFGQVVCGKTPSKEVKENFGGNIPFIKIPDMHNQVFVLETVDSLSVPGAASQKNKTLPKNSICVSCIATVGLVSMTVESSQTNQQINSVIPGKDMYREYLYLTLQAMKSELTAVGRAGSATLNVNTTVFSNLSIIRPSDEILKDFHNTTSPLFEKILQNYKQIIALSKTRDTLLPKLMKGEIRVS